MIKQSKKIDAAKVKAAIQRSLDFWATIDGSKLAKVSLQDKDMDIVGREKNQK